MGVMRAGTCVKRSGVVCVWEAGLLEYQITPQGKGAVTLTLAGVINEDAELAFQRINDELVEAKAAGVVVDFDKVSGINSLGVRGWVQFLRTIEPGRKVLFARCPPIIVMQINMIPSFLDKATVTSFYANYICPACGETKTALLETTKIPKGTLPEPPKCPKTGDVMETEELEDEYFAFLLW